MRILVVEDEEKLARLVARGLTEEGHAVDVCADGDQAAEQALASPYDVIVLDWSLPGRDGVQLLRLWRERGMRTPVLMLTARGTVGEKVITLRAGADDHLVKPFAFEELLARLEALHRRGAGDVGTLALGTARVDRGKRAVVVGEKSEPLTAREFALLDELASRKGEVLTRTHLLSKVWGLDFEGSPNLVDVYIGYVRGKLRDAGAEDVRIDAVRGIGYRLTVEGE
ncbi:response regulator transcription factor [Vulgatibacter incomptus]|uniref:DNA-binding heavy metal response regulator n=1 Tax=Vulgatibacter incomptus TaxID=1391653 RepID=A0A0K1PG54_9BACT|nr:response regulator transcription factor [Vulgatibacter incomptus]AKU92487.1 DNA-binding heavy metal response regulator [Vulgatibacter incomptus]